MGLVLMQRGKPIFYHSKMFRGKVLNYPTYDKELNALVQVVQKWNHYMMRKKPLSIEITDHYNKFSPRVSCKNPYIISGWVFGNSSILSSSIRMETPISSKTFFQGSPNPILPFQGLLCAWNLLPVMHTKRDT